MREGYKKTALGEIPESWEVVNVGNVCKLKGGFAFKSSDACEEGVRWLKIANVGIKEVKWNDESFLPLEFNNVYQEYILKENDIVIAMTRPILGDELKIAKITKNDEGSLLNQRVGKIEVNNELIKDYSFQIFNYAQFISTMKKELMGTDPPNISSTMFENLKIPLPPLAEQEKIAEILSTVDEKIEVVEQQITETKELKKGLMQRLLTKGIGHTQFKNSPLGEIPESWEVKKLGDLKSEEIIFKIQDGNHGESHPVSSDFVDEGIPFVMANCITQANQLDTNIAKRISQEQYDSLRIGFSEPNDVLLTHKGTVGLTAIVKEEHGSIMLTPQVTYYRVFDETKLKKEYLYYTFQSSYFQKILDKYSKQSTRAYIGITNQQKLSIPLPPLAEQEKIAEILSTVDEKLEVLNEKKGNYQELKKGLMQQLLTGNIRVV